MDHSLLFPLVVAGMAGLLAALALLTRDRHVASTPDGESPFAVSTEGEKRCPSCGMGNLWTDRTCVSCGRALQG
ncbi:MAG TPA: hypothetical protein VFR93_05965 [Candidatus Limnocylindrales bacterium]|nr:hypothetical protein [Candidatus Limnocylindrales bacterium]